MSYTHHERLSGMDASFLELEDAQAHMHIASVALFDARPLRDASGGLDFERILDVARSALRTSERFRQKLARVPGLGHPVWVDDDRFNLLYHVRHTALPAPGSERMLKRLAGRILSQQLDRSKPLWETWYVEGVEGERFAVITKLHHCLADGVSGARISAGMLGSDPEWRPREPAPWIPRPAPGGARLLADELWHRVGRPLALAASGSRALRAGARPGALRDTARGLGHTLASLRPASATPFNADLGPHRRFDWTGFDLAGTRAIKERHGAKLNDVVLAVVAGAVRRFLRGRGLAVDDLDFRALVPVSVRRAAEDGAFGNRISEMLARLPVDEPDPVRRLERVVELTGELKRSNQPASGALLSELADWLGTGLLARVARLGLRVRAANVVVTNVPGSPVPIHLLGARMLAVYPTVPLAAHQTLGIAVFSYAGGLYWGFNSDWDALPDLHELVLAVEAEHEALIQTVGGPAAEVATSGAG